MKIFAFIMGCLVLAFSCMPCADAEAGSCKSKMEIKNATKEEKQHNDICSPFCHCACCAGFTINHFIAKIASPYSIQRAEYSSVITNATFTISLPIWQPPRLS